MPNANVFCNTPWYELHIYWDGSFGICCTERHKLYNETEQQYNIARMSISDWFNSQPVRNFRMAMFGDTMSSVCGRCYKEEQASKNSRRLRSNQKSVIFTKTAFDASWLQSPGQQLFQHSMDTNGLTTSQPIDLHIDLGNYCNLACKMCDARASTTIASQEVQWGIQASKPFLGQDWTRDVEVWTRFKQQLLEIPQLNNIHFMGGETLLTPRLEDLVDFMIEHNRYDLCFSFVTNGTQYNEQLMSKLARFKRVGIEISIESLNRTNDYVRQGSNVNQVLDIIQQHRYWTNRSNITVTLRPAPSLLTIGSFPGLLTWALDNQLIVKGNAVIEPKFLDISILPNAVKEQYIRNFEPLIAELDSVSTDSDYNASDAYNVRMVIKDQVKQCVSALKSPQPKNVDHLLTQLVEHCKKWDSVYGLNAREIYPELVEIWDHYDY